MSGQTLTHKDLANALGVSETTVKSYRRKFPGCFPVASKGKPIRFRDEAREVALRIRDLFGTGMSVEEVHDRLAEDFPWWNPKEQGGAKREAQRSKAELPQNFAAAVSNMARSMISLNQQQASILSALRRLEALLAESGFSASPPEAQGAAGAGAEFGLAQGAALKETQREIAAINVRLHSLTQSLAEQKAEAAEERAALLSALEKMAGLAPAKSAAQVIKFEPPAAKAPTEAAAAPAAPQPEFPRKILALPLVVRTEDGAYLSAGGRSIGRISLNDLKAILAQTYLPPEHFSISWEHRPEGWWIRFSQRAIPEPMESTSIGILVQEITSSKGVSVLEVFQYTYNGKDCPTIDLVRFVTGMGKD